MHEFNNNKQTKEVKWSHLEHNESANKLIYFFIHCQPGSPLISIRQLSWSVNQSVHQSVSQSDNQSLG